jgi:hypothetical protein
VPVLELKETPGNFEIFREPMVIEFGRCAAKRPPKQHDAPVPIRPGA